MTRKVYSNLNNVQASVIAAGCSKILLEVSYAIPLMLLGHGIVEVTPPSTGIQHDILQCMAFIG